jgi:hypothetical protein
MHRIPLIIGMHDAARIMLFSLFENRDITRISIKWGPKYSLVSIYMNIYTYTYMYIYVYIYVYVHVYVYIYYQPII